MNRLGHSHFHRGFEIWILSIVVPPIAQFASKPKVFYMACSNHTSSSGKSRETMSPKIQVGDTVTVPN